MDTGAPRNASRSSQQKSAVRTSVIVDSDPYAIPNLGFELPLVDQYRGFGLGDKVIVPVYNRARAWIGHVEYGFRSTARGGGLADAFGALKCNRDDAFQGLVKDGIDHTSPVTHLCILASRRLQTRQIVVILLGISSHSYKAVRRFLGVMMLVTSAGDS